MYNVMSDNDQSAEVRDTEIVVNDVLESASLRTFSCRKLVLHAQSSAVAEKASRETSTSDLLHLPNFLTERAVVAL
jgi:hypothetical protein